MDRLMPGVLIEALWDVEVTTKNGRRAGVQSTRTLWWKGEVLEIRKEAGRVIGKVRWEEQDGIAETASEIYFFPGLLREVQDVNLQNEWRYLRSSGDPAVNSFQGSISSSVEVTSKRRSDPAWDIEENNSLQVGGQIRRRKQPSAANDTAGRKINKFNDSLQKIILRVDNQERFLNSLAQSIANVVGRGADCDRVAGKAFSFLRRKAAILFQRQLGNARYRAVGPSQMETTEEGQHDQSASGLLRIETDCTLQDFEAIARSIRALCPAAEFSPRYELTQNPSSSMAHATINFPTFQDLCACLGINSASDRLEMLKREKACGGEYLNDDSAVRILGAFVNNNESSSAPCALLIGSCITKNTMGLDLPMLFRRDLRYDVSNARYVHSMRYCEKNPKEIMDLILDAPENRSPSACSSLEQTAEERINSLEPMGSHGPLSGGDLRFSLRWRAINAPRTRSWSKQLSNPEEVLGCIEATFPFFLARGRNTVLEVLKLLSDDVLSKVLSTN